MAYLCRAFNNSKADHLKTSPDFNLVDFLKTQPENGWLPDVSGIQLSSFQIPVIHQTLASQYIDVECLTDLM